MNRKSIFAFAMFVLVVCLGTPRQARATNVCEAPHHRQVERGDTLWKYARQAYGYGTTYDVIADANQIVVVKKGQILVPKNLLPGKDILIPCMQEIFVPMEKSEVKFNRSTQPTAVSVPVHHIVSTEKIVSAPKTNISFSLPAEIVPPNMKGMVELDPILVAPIETVAPPLFVEANDHPPLSEPVAGAVKTPQPAIQPMVAIRVPETKLKQGETYEVVFPVDPQKTSGARAGTFPALLYENLKEIKGSIQWKNPREITINVREDQNGLTGDIVLQKPPKGNSAVAGDFQNGSSLLIAKDYLGQGKPSKARVPKSLKKRNYTALKEAFPEPVNKGKEIFRFAMPIAVRSGMGFAVGGPPGALIGAGSLFTELGLRKLSQAQRLQSPPPPIQVEYVIATTEHQPHK